MKRIVFAVVVSFLITVCYILYAQGGGIGAFSNEIKDKVASLEERYNDRFYLAVFSLDEFRSYSIVKLDKLIENYQNAWIAPDDIVFRLDASEKDSIKMNTIYMIEEIYKNRKDDMLDRIRYWCMADVQFEFLEKRFDFDRHTVMKAIVETNYDFNFNDEVIKKTPENSGFEQGIDEEKTYHATLNLLSGLEFDNQLKYYSKIYYQLASFEHLGE